MRRTIPFATKSADELSSRQQTRERLINMYWTDDAVRTCLATSQEGAVSVGSGPVYGLTEFRGDMYAASGGFLWNVSTQTRIGSMRSGRAQFATDGRFLAMASGGEYAVWDGERLTRPETGVLENIVGVEFLDGFIILAARDGKFGVATLNDPTNIDALDFATAESHPDGLVGLAVISNTLHLFGDRTTEQWFTSGGLDFPFSRIQGGSVPRGSTGGIVEIDSTVIFISDDNRIMATSSGGTNAISTEPLDRLISQYDADLLSAFTFDDDGHKFYALRFPDRPTWCLDTRTSLWHERSTGMADGTWDVAATVQFGGKWYAGTDDGRVLLMAGRETDDGGIYRRVAQGVPIITSGYSRFTVSELEINARMGRRSDGESAQVAFEFSRDGETWSEARLRPLGSLGQYNQRASFFGLGQWREMHTRVTVTDPVDFQIYSMNVDVARDLS